jgi:hypothetical protein
MHKTLAPHEAIRSGSRPGMQWLAPPIISATWGEPARSDRSMPVVPFIDHQRAEGRVAQYERLIEHRIKDGGEIAGRGVDDLQDFSGGSLSGQRLVPLNDAFG